MKPCSRIIQCGKGSICRITYCGWKNITQEKLAFVSLTEALLILGSFGLEKLPNITVNILGKNVSFITQRLP